MKNQFTPGPWSLNFNYPGGVHVEAAGECVARVFGNRHDNPDARLIAAAPCLAAGLREALQLIAEMEPGSTSTDIMELRERLNDLLRKATGGAESDVDELIRTGTFKPGGAE